MLSQLFVIMPVVLDLDERDTKSGSRVSLRFLFCFVLFCFFFFLLFNKE